MYCGVYRACILCVPQFWAAQFCVRHEHGGAVHLQVCVCWCKMDVASSPARGSSFAYHALNVWGYHNTVVLLCLWCDIGCHLQIFFYTVLVGSDVSCHYVIYIENIALNRCYLLSCLGWGRVGVRVRLGEVCPPYILYPIRSRSTTVKSLTTII